MESDGRVTFLAGPTGNGRRKEDLPAFPPDAQPVVYHVRRLKRSEVFDHVEAVSSAPAKAYRAFTIGLVKVTGGRFGDGWEPESARGRSTAKHVSEEELDQMEFSPGDISDIGNAIYVRSVAPKGSTPHLPRPPTSLDVWVGNARLYAARHPERAPQSSSPPRGE